jgi:hypothetical protein
VIAKAHAVAVVEQHDDFTRAGTNRRGIVVLNERTREGEDDESQRGKPDE